MGTTAKGAVLAAALAISTLAAPAAAFAEAPFEIALRGDPEGIANEADDLFSRIPALSPGGSGSDCARIVNESDALQRVWLAVEDWAQEPDGAAAKLLDGVSVHIGYDAKTVYEGAIRGEGLHDPVMLGELAPGEAAELDWTLTASSGIEASGELSNAVRWTLIAEELEQGAQEAPEGSSPIAETGDAVPLGAACAVASMAALGAWQLVRKEGRS